MIIKGFLDVNVLPPLLPILGLNLILGLGGVCSLVTLLMSKVIGCLTYTLIIFSSLEILYFMNPFFLSTHLFLLLLPLLICRFLYPATVLFPLMIFLTLHHLIWLLHLLLLLPWTIPSFKCIMNLMMSFYMMFLLNPLNLLLIPFLWESHLESTKSLLIYKLITITWLLPLPLLLFSNQVPLIP